MPISTKFKPGQRVRYIHNGVDLIGEVALEREANEFERMYPGIFNGVNYVVGRWNATTLQIAEERYCFIVGQRYKRNLPDWF